MFTLYFIGGILVLAAAIYGLIKLNNRLEDTYDYNMFDWVNIGILCTTAVVTLLIIGICIGHEGQQYQGGIFDGPKYGDVVLLQPDSAGICIHSQLGKILVALFIDYNSVTSNSSDSFAAYIIHCLTDG